MAKHETKLQKCVDLKIPILITEGRKQDQAIAEAFSVCRKREEKRSRRQNKR